LGSLPLRLTEREACITDLESAPSAALPRSSLGLPHLNAEPAQGQCQMQQGKIFVKWHGWALTMPQAVKLLQNDLFSSYPNYQLIKLNNYG
ncbi:hypothetical protein, partial [Candidatus Methylobacter favarea]|uniref:hypothetical protein n=1 Tax=Candidatus Methylobacter favarea TaxID=2707345 RepID=UPI001C2D8FF7